PSKNDEWVFDMGIKFSINTFKYNKNYQSHLSYQTGYADNFIQHFSLNGTVHRTFLRWGNLKVNAMANLHLTWHSLKMNAYYYNVNNEIVDHSVLLYGAAPAVELTIGPSVE